jgi:alkylation response protein AidB-like acyl-CoA dehydrogenase
MTAGKGTRDLFDADHELFRDTVRSFIAAEVEPHAARWGEQRRVDRSLYEAAGKAGLLLPDAPAEFGGVGVGDWRFNAVLDEEFGRSGHAAVGLGFNLQNDVVGSYLTEVADTDQKRRWLPGLVSGELIGAIAMTEPDAGSDLAGIRTAATPDGGGYRITGSKTFISNGQNADLVIVAARTAPDRHRGLSLFVVESDSVGFARGRLLDKIGLHAQDTSELHFTDVHVPASHRLGAEGEGFLHLMRNLPRERLSLAVTAVGAAEGMLALTLDHVGQRTAFGTTLGSFQHTRFLLAELSTEIDVARTYVDHCIDLHTRGELTAVQAAKAKWWTTELQVRVADRCLQLHGGYGYMTEYPIARAFVDSRIQTIYGGTTEIMKEIIGRHLVS